MEAVTDRDAVGTAWCIHEAIGNWTAKADVKASFALSIESAVLAGVIALSATGKPFNGLTNGTLWLYRAGVLLLVVGVVAAVAAVIPQVRARPMATEWPKNFIFFGHLRHWEPEALATTLQETDPLPVLTRQLVATSKIAWNKHRLLQVSLICAVAGSGGVMLAARLAP